MPRKRVKPDESIPEEVADLTLKVEDMQETIDNLNKNLKNRQKAYDNLKKTHQEQLNQYRVDHEQQLRMRSRYSSQETVKDIKEIIEGRIVKTKIHRDECAVNGNRVGIDNANGGIVAFQTILLDIMNSKTIG